MKSEDGGMLNKRELLKKTKCQLEGGLRDGDDSQALSSFNYHFKLTFCQFSYFNIL